MKRYSNLLILSPIQVWVEIETDTHFPGMIVLSAWQRALPGEEYGISRMVRDESGDMVVYGRVDTRMPSRELLGLALPELRLITTKIAELTARLYLRLAMRLRGDSRCPWTYSAGELTYYKETTNE